MEERIYMSSPHMSGDELDYIREAFSTNWVAPLGPNVDAFERELADRVGAEGALALCSGTAALHMALRLLGVTKGDVVFCSTLTFVASANPILYEGAIPVFIDSEPETWNMSTLALERALREAEEKKNLPKAVITVNLYGQSADYDQILALCDSYGVPVIEDAAESLGATYKGKASGTFGRFGVYSFNGNKIITTSGGGMLVSDDLEALSRARHLSAQARDPARHYQHSEPGYNYRMSNVLAGIGRGQLRVLDERVEARRQIYQRYQSRLSNLAGIGFMAEASFGRSTHWLTAMTVEPKLAGTTATSIIEELASRNIESRPVWKPMHMQPLFATCTYYPHEPSDNVSERLFESGICLPSGSNMTSMQQERVIEAVMACLKVSINA